MDNKSMVYLDTVKPSLKALVLRASALSSVAFRVTCGIRTPEQQRSLYKAGLSRTLRSKHLTGDAVDVVAILDGYHVSWDFGLYAQINEAFKKASAELSIPYRWGGGFKTLRDGCHFELVSTSQPRTVTT